MHAIEKLLFLCYQNQYGFDPFLGSFTHVKGTCGEVTRGKRGIDCSFKNFYHKIIHLDTCKIIDSTPDVMDCSLT